jgi:hypothetical protein
MQSLKRLSRSRSRSTSARESLGIGALLLLLLACYWTIFGATMPRAGAQIGADYSLHFPNLLVGYYWWRQNGFLALPWFSPATCGGVPYLPDLNVVYHSVPQALTLVAMPTAAIQATIVVFQALGFIGFYLLLRARFLATAAAAAFGATLFLFNGFFLHRMAVGHLTFHAFMLLPLLIWALLPPAAPGMMGIRWNWLTATATAALGFAYMFHSGMVHLLPPSLLAIAAIFLIHALRFGWSWQAWSALAASGPFAIGLSLVKLAPAVAVLASFPRDHYALPGVESLPETARLAFRALFFDPPAEAGLTGIRNAAFVLETHEWAYGLTVVPLFFMLIAAGRWAWRGMTGRATFVRPLRTLSLTMAITVLLAIPLLLNWYNPSWTAVLKALPFFGSSSNLLRWFAAYIPIAVVLAALALDSFPLPAAAQPRCSMERPRLVLAGIAILAVVAINARPGTVPILEPTYSGAVIDRAYLSTRSTGVVPPITEMRLVSRDDADVIDRDNIMVEGASQIVCYQPIFGYSLERFPYFPLRPGPALSRIGPVLNVKNPACYLFPRDNDCRPGTHFDREDEPVAAEFLAYRPIRFRGPGWFDAEPWVNAACLGAAAALLLSRAVGAWRARRIASRDRCRA